MKTGQKTTGGPAAFLLIEQGNPGDKGRYAPLPADKLLIGRPTSTFSPDLGLDNFLISRRHCCLTRQGDGWTLADLGSKHGTTLNGRPLAAHAVHPLAPGDKISLAAGAALFRFLLLDENEKTLEFERTHPGNAVDAAVDAAPAPPIVVDLAKMELVVADTTVALSAKEWLLLETLYSHRNRFVSYGDIRAAVWPERYAADCALPEVGVEELSVLIYRLRRKLGPYGNLIKIRRGRGCILEY